MRLLLDFPLSREPVFLVTWCIIVAVSVFLLVITSHFSLAFEILELCLFVCLLVCLFVCLFVVVVVLLLLLHCGEGCCFVCYLCL